MKNQKLFDRTIGILVNAYLNNTLEHAECSCCAVGNLVAANCGIKLFRDEYDNISSGGNYAKVSMWYDAILGKGVYSKEVYNSSEITRKQIQSTGYSLEEVAKIEASFESIGMAKDSDGYIGLMAVCDTLMQIHEANEEEITQAKRLFVKEPA